MPGGKSTKVQVTPAAGSSKAARGPAKRERNDSQNTLTEEEVKLMENMEGEADNRGVSPGRQSKRAWTSKGKLSTITARTSAKYPNDRHMQVIRGAADTGGMTYPKNTVITSSYTVFNFPFKNLWLQFQNLANVYFLFVGILQCIPSISTTNGYPSMYLTLSFILTVSAFRAATEDWGKHKADNARNGYKYTVLGKDGEWTQMASGDLKVGTIIQVKKDEMVPADLILLSSSHDKGQCFIDKANLNGETKLEVLSSHTSIRPLASASAIKNFSCSLVWEPPNKKFDSLRAMIILPSGAKIAIDGQLLMMRETNLRNTDFVNGIVVYSGNDTKIQRSNLEGEKPRVKSSKISKAVNKYLIGMMLAQTLLCVVAGVIHIITHKGMGGQAHYLSFTQEPVGSGLLVMWTFFILLCQMVPISLVVSSEMVKFVQSTFIQWDAQLYHVKINKKAKCNVSTIHEDLGLVDFVFSDKTGTLTQNKMEFRFAQLQKGHYGSMETDIARAVKKRQAEYQARVSGRIAPPRTELWTDLQAPFQMPLREEDRKKKTGCMSKIWNGPQTRSNDANAVDKIGGNVFSDMEKTALLAAIWSDNSSKKAATEVKELSVETRRFMMHMALSNTVKPFLDKNLLKFQADSAEELAMVEFARTLGFTKLQNNPTKLEIRDVRPRQSPAKRVEEYSHVATFGFSSKRARVTVIYQKKSDLSVHVMTKGQDSVVLPLLKSMKNKDKIVHELSDMYSNGLRALVMAHSTLPADWWKKHKDKYQEIILLEESALAAGHGSFACAGSGKCELCVRDDYFLSLEKDAKLEYLGCLGLEDQLQPLVPETIAACLRANIKVWMITGDKLETAKNIALACNLIDSDMEPNIPSEGSLLDLVNALDSRRLVEITGEWSELSDDIIEGLFDIFDSDETGQLDLSELKTAMRCLRFSLTEERVNAILHLSNVKGEKVSKQAFVRLLKSVRLSAFEAVKFEIEEGIHKYNDIVDHELLPVSLLVSRTAFEVLFPGKAAKTEPPTAEQLKKRRDSLHEHMVTPDMRKDLQKKFFLLASLSKSVVFARAQPAMKKKMVTEIMARFPEVVTLAVGDGANDTDMITSAHLGVGIAGVEGTAATNSSDYAIGTFRFLHELLFVHGYWNYARASNLVVFIFYKASLLAISAFFFGVYSAFSGQQFFNDFLLQLYNVVFTALPVIFAAVLDKPLPRVVLQNSPELYREGKHTKFSAKIFYGWVLRALVHSAILYYVPHFALGGSNVISANGQNVGLWLTSTVTYFSVCILPTLLIMFNFYTITFLHWLALASSVSSIFVFAVILDVTSPTFGSEMNGIVTLLLANPKIWLVMIISLAIPLLMELTLRAARDVTLEKLFQERVRLRSRDKKPLRSCVLTKEQDQQWLSSKIKTNLGKHVEDKETVSRSMKNLALGKTERGAPIEGMKRERTDSIRVNIVQCMHLIKNRNGGTYDSAARAKFQKHDIFRMSQAENKLMHSIVEEEAKHGSN